MCERSSSRPMASTTIQLRSVWTDGLLAGTPAEIRSAASFSTAKAVLATAKQGARFLFRFPPEVSPMVAHKRKAHNRAGSRTMDDILGYVSQIELMAGVAGLIRHDLRGQGCSFACARIGRGEFTQPRQTAKVITVKPHTIAATPSQKSGIIISLGLTWRSADAFRHLITRSNLVGWPGANQPAFRFCDLLYQISLIRTCEPIGVVRWT
jgi:hypothetical protein